MNPNPALAAAGPLAGTWQMEIYNGDFLPGPDARITGRATIDWTDDGAALVMRQGDPPSTPWASWIIGRDEEDSDFLVLYADDRGISRIYQMSLEGPDWRMWRTTRDFTQRFSAHIDPDGDVIRGRWEKSADGGTTWQHDFNLDYIRSEKS
jgi:Tol biopolymer transport system component